MPLFIVGCVLAGITVILIPLLCILLIKNEKAIKKLDWRIYLIVFAIAAIGIAAIALLFAGHAQM